MATHRAVVSARVQAPVLGSAREVDPTAVLAAVPASDPTSTIVAGSNALALAPEAIGLDVLDGYRLVRQHRLRVAISVWETKIGPWGQVLAQDPDPGTAVPLGSRIQLVVSGRPHLTVPDVRNLPLSVALDTLRRLGLQPEVPSERRSRTVAAGHVVSTQPRAGALVADGSRVSLEISKPHLEC